MRCCELKVPVVRLRSHLCTRMLQTQRVFQISGIKEPQEKREVHNGICKLGGKYLGGSIYREGTTHLIARHCLASEKFLAFCAAGKWIVSPEYVMDSVKIGTWLSEEAYELEVTGHASSIPKPLRLWRTRVGSGSISGAFQNWRVILLIDDPNKSDVFRRILCAGKAHVYPATTRPGGYVTHVLHENVSVDKGSMNAPCFNLDLIAEHLFGFPWSQMPVPSVRLTALSQSDTAVMNASSKVDDTLLFSELEDHLREHVARLDLLHWKIVSMEEPRYRTVNCQPQCVIIEFGNVKNLTECGLLSEALEEIQSTLQPGVLPPSHYFSILLQYALQGNGNPYFNSTLITVLHDILRYNPPWGSPVLVKYFTQVLQCPKCKGGTLALLETSVRWCMSSGPCCHSLPGPPSPEMISFHANLQAFMLKLFQKELSATCSGQCEASRASLIIRTFSSIWERSTLNSKALQQLVELLISATRWALPPTEDWKKGLVRTLHDIIATVVEHWCWANSKLNKELVKTGLKNMAEHISILCQDMPPEFFLEFIPSVSCMHLRMVTAHAIYRSICRKYAITFENKPLNLETIVSSYLPALGKMFEQSVRGPWLGAGLNTTSCHSDSGGRELSQRLALPILGKKNIPKGLHKVNRAGETLIHRACRRNQVETLLQILSLPGTDVNVRDYAGWTPLHEACNHGSTECVQTLLQHCSTLNLNVLVDGVSPLHSALHGGHLNIAKILLRFAGSTLLEQHNSSLQELVTCPTLREELRQCAKEGDSTCASPWLAAGSCVLSCLLQSYLMVQGVPDMPSPPNARLLRALVTHSARLVTASWSDPRLVELACDLETLLGVSRYVRQVNEVMRGSQGPHTQILIMQLDALEAEGGSVLTGPSM